MLGNAALRDLIAAHPGGGSPSREFCVWSRVTPPCPPGARFPTCPWCPDLVGAFSFHCDYNVAMSAPEPPAGHSIPGEPASPPPTGSRLPCCATQALVSSAWFGVFVLVPFLPHHHCTGLSVSPTAPFSMSLLGPLQSHAQGHALGPPRPCRRLCW